MHSANSIAWRQELQKAMLSSYVREMLATASALALIGMKNLSLVQAVGVGALVGALTGAVMWTFSRSSTSPVATVEPDSNRHLTAPPKAAMLEKLRGHAGSRNVGIVTLRGREERVAFATQLKDVFE